MLVTHSPMLVVLWGVFLPRKVSLTSFLPLNPSLALSPEQVQFLPERCTTVNAYGTTLHSSTMLCQNHNCLGVATFNVSVVVYVYTYIQRDRDRQLTVVRSIFRFEGDTCKALEDFQQDPYNSSLSSILPCDELLSAKPVLNDISRGIYRLIDEVIFLYFCSRYPFSPSFSPSKRRKPFPHFPFLTF